MERRMTKTEMIATMRACWLDSGYSKRSQTRLQREHTGCSKPIELVYLKIVKSETFANHLLAATSPPPWWNPHPLWNEKIVINKIGKRWRFCWSKSSSSNCDQTISVTHGAPTWNNLNLSCHQPPPQHYWFKNQFCDKLLKYWNWLITWIW